MAKMMRIEEFNSEREFRKKFKSKLYVCCWCNKMTPNPYICTNFNNQANQLFSENTYKFIIKSIHTEVQQIFKPIEYYSEEQKGT